MDKKKELETLNKEYKELENRYADGYNGGWDDTEYEEWMEDAVNLLSRFKDFANKICE